ncbi:MAG: hypothetical protein OEY79_00250 [Anaplasmataceae bacterium]|nr:hypothetical protein [Anaplasmataceae bacterium]
MYNLFNTNTIISDRITSILNNDQNTHVGYQLKHFTQDSISNGKIYFQYPENHKNSEAVFKDNTNNEMIFAKFSEECNSENKCTANIDFELSSNPLDSIRFTPK